MVGGSPRGQQQAEPSGDMRHVAGRAPACPCRFRLLARPRRLAKMEAPCRIAPTNTAPGLSGMLPPSGAGVSIGVGGEEAEDFDAFTVGAVALHAAVSAPEWAAAWALVGIGENTIGAWLDRLRAVDGGKPGSLIDIAPIGAGEAQWSEAMRSTCFRALPTSPTS